MYIAYHMTSDSTIFGDLDKNGVRDLNEKMKIGYSLYLYAFILLTHILLSIILIPMVLISYVRAIQKNLTLIKKLQN